MSDVRKRKEESSEKPEKPKKKRKPKTSNKPPNGVVLAVLAILIGVIAFSWSMFTSGRTIAPAGEDVDIFEKVTCSEEHSKKPQVNGCTPTKCGRMVIDGLIAPRELEVLKRLAIEGTQSLGGGKGGVSILELSSSTVSSGEKFQSLFQLRESAVRSGNDPFKKLVEKIYSKDNLATYYSAKEKVKTAIEVAFGLEDDVLSLASPTFFSYMTRDDPKSDHDEYWHSHIDVNQYPSFDYTALIYLNTYEQDFKGGRFFFEPSKVGETSEEIAIEPKAGRLSAFTSGAENPHRVERVAGLQRLAFTMGFTCNTKFAIETPSLPSLPDE